MTPREKISRACTISGRILRRIPAKVAAAPTEKELARFIEGEMRKAGGKRSFRTIVSSGKNTSEIHHRPTDSVIGKGFLMIDLGVNYKGYTSDITRMFYVGKPSARERKLYRLVLKAQQQALQKVRDGAHARDIDAVSRKVLGRYRKYFRHSLGHGLGKKVHTTPYLKPRSRQLLREGMIITLEPGIYFRGKFGIRIEDDVVVTRRGHKLLSRFPRTLQLVRAKL